MPIGHASVTTGVGDPQKTPAAYCSGQGPVQRMQKCKRGQRGPRVPGGAMLRCRQICPSLITLSTHRASMMPTLFFSGTRVAGGERLIP